MTKLPGDEGSRAEADERCRWCRRPLVPRTGPGRPRAFCRRSCRQRDYEARRRASAHGLDEHELIVARAELDRLRDELFVLQCAVQDVERDLAEDGSPGAHVEAVRWLLEAARPLLQAGLLGA